MNTEVTFYDFGEKETEENAVYYSEDNIEEDVYEEPEKPSLSRSASTISSGINTVKRTSSMVGFLFGTVRKGSQSVKPEERLPNLEIKLLSAKGLPGNNSSELDLIL